MTRDILIVSAANMKCERVFNTAKAIYDHRKFFNLVIFFAYMMIRFHDQKKNSQARLDANLTTKKKMSIEDREKKMKKRISELQIVYNKIYINDDEEKDVVSQDMITRKALSIR
jgi:hypothetical protein